MTEFDTLYTSYHDAIVLFCLSRVRSREVAEDLTQEIFLGVWKVFPRLEGQEGGGIKAYIYKAAQNKVIDYTRHMHLIEWDVLDDEQPIEEDFTARIEQRESIMETLDTMTPFHRETLDAWLYDKRAIMHAPGFKMLASRVRKNFQRAYREQEEVTS